MYSKLFENREDPQMEVKGKLPSGREERLEFLFVSDMEDGLFQENYESP